MKKYFLLLSVLTLQMAVSAQTVNVHLKNGQSVNYPAENVDFVDFSDKPENPSVTAGEAIDLGLSVKWASCNLGATKPEDYGNYYAWGETSPKESYGKSNYSYYNAETDRIIDIGEDIGGTSYDAAHVNLDNGWRMPTYKEMDELVRNCNWEWVNINNVRGYRVTANNGNSIFLPAAGYYIGNTISKINEWPEYFTSTNDDQKEAYGLVDTGHGPVIIGLDKIYGKPIRPVKK